MEESQKYKCPYCGIEHSNPREMALCIIRCEEKRKEEEERQRKEQLQAEKKRRAEDVDRAYRDYVDLASKYHNDYGEVFSFKKIIGLPENFWDVFCV